MSDSHNRSFFGQSTGIILRSPSKSDDFIFIQCLKKKGNGIWQKPSKGEGKTIKLNLEEIAMIKFVFKGELQNWSTYHKYNGINTQISFNWETKSKEISEQKIWIRIDEYAKMLNAGQIEIFKALLNHLFNEKIKNATVNKGKYQNSPSKSTDKRENCSNSQIMNENNIERKIQEINRKDLPFSPPPVKESNEENLKEELQSVKFNENTPSLSKISGKIKVETNKALLIEFDNGSESWIPKSVINSKYSPIRERSQNFKIEKWILEKNNLITS